MLSTGARGGQVVDLSRHIAGNAAKEHEVVINGPTLSVCRIDLPAGRRTQLGSAHNGLIVIALEGQVELACAHDRKRLATNQLFYAGPGQSYDVEATCDSRLVVTMLAAPPMDVVDEASQESFPASDPPARTPITGEG